MKNHKYPLFVLIFCMLFSQIGNAAFSHGKVCTPDCEMVMAHSSHLTHWPDQNSDKYSDKGENTQCSQLNCLNMLSVIPPSTGFNQPLFSSIIQDTRPYLAHQAYLNRLDRPPKSVVIKL